MREPIRYKFVIWARSKICRITGHEYDCCDNVFKRCSQCAIVKAEEEYWKELVDEYERLHWDIRP